MSGEILLIEDDPHVTELIKVCLEQENFRVTAAEDGESGFELIKAKKFDLVILDIMLPKKDGWQICRELNAEEFAALPILILTAKSSETDRVLGLELGADDYLVKPFSPRELVARIRAILRRVERVHKKREPASLNFRQAALDLTIDPARYAVTVQGAPVSLTPKEFELLYFLASEPGKIFKREQLLEHIWGIEYPGTTRTVDEHVKKLRKKLKTACAREIIQTVWGVGYKFEVS